MPDPYISDPFFTLVPGTVTVEEMRSAYRQHRQFEFSSWTAGIIASGRETIDAIVRKGDAVYGVNTGFGKLAQKRIADEDLNRLQRNIVRSHAAGTGEPLPDNIVSSGFVVENQFAGPWIFRD